MFLRCVKALCFESVFRMIVVCFIGVHGHIGCGYTAGRVIGNQSPDIEFIGEKQDIEHGLPAIRVASADLNVRRRDYPWLDSLSIGPCPRFYHRQEGDHHNKGQKLTTLSVLFHLVYSFVCRQQK